MKMTITTIETKRFLIDRCDCRFFVLAVPMIDSDYDGGNWYSFYLGCDEYGPIDFLYGMQVLEHEWETFNSGFFEHYIFDYINEHIAPEN